MLYRTRKTSVCLLHCNQPAEDGLQEIRRAGDKNAEGRLARLADLDTTEQANGLGLLAKTVSDWSKDPVLSLVKKYRSGRHRYYFVGTHTDCEYHLRFMLVNKKDADDRPKQKWFQDKVLKAVADVDIVRTLPPPEVEEAEE